MKSSFFLNFLSRISHLGFGALLGIAIVLVGGVGFAALTAVQNTGGVSNLPYPPTEAVSGQLLTSASLNNMANDIIDLHNRTRSVHTDTSGNVGVGTNNLSPGLKLDVEGKVGAVEYCDKDGLKCFKAENPIWENVPLTDQADYDIEHCEYRAYMTSISGGANKAWFGVEQATNSFELMTYPTGISKKYFGRFLTWNADGTFLMWGIRSVDKRKYGYNAWSNTYGALGFNNFTDNNVSRMEKRCNY